MDSYRRAIEIDPDHTLAHYNLGIAFEAQGDLDEAIASYRKAIASDPDYARAHHNLGIALRSQGKKVEAEAVLARARELEAETD